MQMRSSVMWAVAGFIAAAAQGQGRVVITEIMYNPASMERAGETEWVEIANLGDQPVEIVDWRLDDEDRTDWGAFSCTLKPGEVAVLINAAAVTVEEFRAAWDEPASGGQSGEGPSYQVIAVQWGGLGNLPGPDNEVLQLLNQNDEVICEVKQEGEWPSCRDPDGPSVYLLDLSTMNLSDGMLWRRSELGIDNARSPRATPIFSTNDIGSPGVLPNASPAPRPVPQTQPATAPSQTQPGTPPATSPPRHGRGPN